MTAALLALILIVLFFGLSRFAREQVKRFLLWAGIIVVVGSVVGVVYLRDVIQQRQAQQQARQETIHQQWVESGPYIVIDHRSELFARGAISIAFHQQCPDISVTESDALGRTDVSDEVAYRVSFEPDYRSLSGKVGNMKVAHEGILVYGGNGSLQTLAKKACSTIKAQQQ